MIDRRTFLGMTTTSLIAPALTGALGVANTASAKSQNAAPTKDQLIAQMTEYLAQELKDQPTAASEIPYIVDFVFTWAPPQIDVAKLDRIVAYAFGNRPNAASGNTPTNGANQVALPDPGPTNGLLADAVYAVYQQKKVKVYAQWEIARFLKSKYNMTDAVSIEPIINPDGTVTYLSTDGVAQAIVALEGGKAENMGVVGVVGFLDHVKRCVLTSRGRGMNAYAPAGIQMPGKYDALSGQAWTRRRDLYLLHDMVAQLTVLRANAIAAAYPNG